MSKRILVVEDNPVNRKLFCDVLQAYGYDVSIAETGQDALRMVDAESPDLILLDIQLPDISGLEIAKTLKADERFKALPIIAVSAFAMAGDAEKALAAGCDDYITKPISISAFHGQIQKMLP